MSQLSMGRKVESEHKKTVQYLKQYLKQHGKLPPESRIYASVASDHLRENRAYYTKLKKAKL